MFLQPGAERLFRIGTLYYDVDIPYGEHLITNDNEYPVVAQFPGGEYRIAPLEELLGDDTDCPNRDWASDTWVALIPMPKMPNVASLGIMQRLEQMFPLRPHQSLYYFEDGYYFETDEYGVYLPFRFSSTFRAPHMPVPLVANNTKLRGPPYPFVVEVFGKYDAHRSPPLHYRDRWYLRMDGDRFGDEQLIVRAALHTTLAMHPSIPITVMQYLANRLNGSVFVVIDIKSSYDTNSGGTVSMNCNLSTVVAWVDIYDDRYLLVPLERKAHITSRCYW